MKEEKFNEICLGGERCVRSRKKKWKFKGILLEHTFDDEGEEEDGSKVLEGCCHLPC